MGDVRTEHVDATFGRGAGDPVADDAPQWPTTIYGATKVFGERLVEYHHRRYGLDARGVRFPSVVGHGRGGTGASGYTSLAFDEPACGRPYALPVGADVRCQLMHVDDAVRALLELDAAPDRDLSRRIYNIAGFEAFFRFTAEHPALYRIIRQAEFVSPPALRDHYEKIAAGYVEGLNRAMRDGEIVEADPQVLAWALMGVGEAIGMRWILWGEEASPGPRRRPRRGAGLHRPRSRGRPRRPVTVATEAPRR